MKTEYTARELAGILEVTKRNILVRAEKENWEFVEARNRGGAQKLYAYESLPGKVRRAIQESELSRDEIILDSSGAEVWRSLPDKEKALALARFEILRAADAYLERKGSKGKVERLREFYDLLQTAIRTDDAETIRHIGFAGEKVRLVTEHVTRVSEKTDYRWRADYQEAERQLGIGVLGLLRKKREAPGFGSRSLSADVIAYARTLILKGQVKLFPEKKNRDRLLTLNRRLLYNRLSTRFGEKSLPHYASFTRWVRRYLVEEGEALAAVCLPSYWRSAYAPKAGSLSEHILYAGQCWEMDGTPSDVMLRDGRHDLLAAVDIYSRDAVIQIDKHASSITVARTIFDGLIRWGKPEEIVCDKGSIFLSDHIQSACEMLSINLRACDAYAPWQKGHVESFFGSLSRMLFEAMTWYVGHDPKERRRIEEYNRFEEVFRHRKTEKISCDATSEELSRIVQDWLEKVYRANPHEFADCHIGRSRHILERISNSPRRAPRVQNTEALDMLLAPGFEREFNSGVKWKNARYVPVNVESWQKAQAFSRRRIMFRPALSDVSKGAMWEIRADGCPGAFICSLSAEGLGGMSLHDYMRAVRAVVNTHKKRRKAVETIFSPPTYEDELRSMPAPKVAAANFGAEEWDGEPYATTAKRGTPPAIGRTKPGLSDTDRARIFEELREKEQQLATERTPPAEEPESFRAPAAEPSIWQQLENMSETDRYEQLLEYEAQGLLIPREHQGRMRIFEQTETYRKLRDYFDKRRAMFTAIHRKRGD